MLGSADTTNKVLITGGAGFIGSNLALALCARGFEVTIMDCLSPQIHTADPSQSYLYRTISDRVPVVKADVTDSEQFYACLQGKNAVIHLAAETGTGQSMYEIARYTRTNVMGTAILMDLLANKSHSVKKVLVASSRAVYGEGKYSCKACGVVFPRGRSNEDLQRGLYDPRCPQCDGTDVRYLPTDESSQLNPGSVYAINKLSQEQLVIQAGRSLGIYSLALRYQNVYGPGQSLSNPYTGILSIFSSLLRQDKPINVFEDGNESRDFVYIDDAVGATILALESNNAAYEALNVGSGQSTKVVDIAMQLKDHYRTDSEVSVSGAYRAGDIRHNVADLRKINELFGYKPKIDFAAGLKLFADWVSQQPTITSTYSDSIAELQKRGLFK